MDELVAQLERLGFRPSRELEEKHGMVMLPAFCIELGPFVGRTIEIAFLGRDFPKTPPAGIHIRPHLVPIGPKNVNPSPLGEDWQYWSRKLTEWKTDRNARNIVSYVRKVLLNQE